MNSAKAVLEVIVKSVSRSFDKVFGVSLFSNTAKIFEKIWFNPLKVIGPQNFVTEKQRDSANILYFCGLHNRRFASVNKGGSHKL